MEIFIDTANLDAINKAVDQGIVNGCTTNPIIVAKENSHFETRMKEILKIVPGPVSIEVTTNDPEGMIKEAEEYAKWGDNVVIKIPMGSDGLSVVRRLTEKGIKTNVTACMNMPQGVVRLIVRS